MTFCCKMREKFLIGIVAENPHVPVPTEAIDFMDFEHKTPDGKPVLRIKWCCFCGSKETGMLRVMNDRP